jgi:hypothetical protein
MVKSSFCGLITIHFWCLFFGSPFLARPHRGRLVPVAALLQLCLASSYQHWMEPSRSYQHLDQLEASLHGAPNGSYAEAVRPLDAGLDGVLPMVQLPFRGSCVLILG